MNIAMIPARIGSQRLAKKNLREIDGVSLLARAIRKCSAANVFDEIWVNADDDIFADIARAEGVSFHQRPSELAGNTATSEDFVAEFLGHHECDRLFQVHSIAPLLGAGSVADFVRAMIENSSDTQLSCTLERIECALDGKPINFRFDTKTNSQDIEPVQRITWGITGWRRDTFLAAVECGETATYSGTIFYFPLTTTEGLLVKTEEDLQLVQAIERGQ